MKPSLRVSVVLPCLNEERNLPRVLGALLAQDLPSELYEVVVVDGGSTDRSVEIAESKGVRVIRAPRGVSVQRNHGAAETTGQVLAFLDSDCVAPTDWLSRGLHMVEGQGAALAGGPALAPDGSGWIAKAWDTHMVTRQQRLVDDDDERFRLITTQNLFIRREVFEGVGGFDVSLVSGEDFFLCLQVADRGMPVGFDMEMTVAHLGVPHSATAFFREQVWHSNREVWRRLSERTGRPVGRSAYHYGRLTIALLALLVVAGVLSVALQTIWPVIAAAAAYAAVPAALAARTSAWAGSAREIVPLTGMYAIYGLARAAYLLGLLRLEYRRSIPVDHAGGGPTGA